MHAGIEALIKCFRSSSDDLTVWLDPSKVFRWQTVLFPGLGIALCCLGSSQLQECALPLLLHSPMLTLFPTAFILLLAWF